MKATDLMIGDWVIEKDRVCRVSFNTTIEEVRKEDCATSASSSTRYDDIEPIHITPEMLDKNGFEQHINALRHPQCSYFELADWSVGWCVHLYPMPNRKYFLETSAHMGRTIAKTTTAKVIEHIHELQHALKYSEIEKEIVL